VSVVSEKKGRDGRCRGGKDRGVCAIEADGDLSRGPNALTLCHRHAHGGDFSWWRCQYRTTWVR